MQDISTIPIWMARSWKRSTEAMIILSQLVILGVLNQALKAKGK